jgi:hypothetical protein
MIRSSKYETFISRVCRLHLIPHKKKKEVKQHIKCHQLREWNRKWNNEWCQGEKQQSWNSQSQTKCQQHRNSRNETACQRRSISRRGVARKQYSKRELAEWNSTWRGTGTHEKRGDIKQHKESTNCQGMWHNTETHGIEHHMKKSVGTYWNEHNKNSRTGITKKFTERDDTSTRFK